MGEASAHLIEPSSGGRISGGYLYNARMAEADARLVRRPVDPAQLDADLRALALPAGGRLLCDSLFLSREHLPPIRRFCDERGHLLAVMLHAFPSFVRRASDREELVRSLPLRPTREEIELLGAVDLLVSPGPYAPRLLAASGSGVRTAICPPGVDRHASPAGPASRARSRVELISIGSVTPLKGFIDAAKALSLAPSSGWRWTIYGHLGIDPEHVRELRLQLQALGLDDRVAMAGQCSHEEVLAALRESDLLLLTSLTENHPLVALEALAAGVPVVGYDVGGLPDIVASGEEGLLSPLLDIPRLSSNLARLLGDPRERRRLSRGAARAGRALPAWSDAAEQLAQTLISIAA